MERYCFTLEGIALFIATVEIAGFPACSVVKMESQAAHLKVLQHRAERVCSIVLIERVKYLARDSIDK